MYIADNLCTFIPELLLTVQIQIHKYTSWYTSKKEIHEWDAKRSGSYNLYLMS